jgi:hypothetical protein
MGSGGLDCGGALPTGSYLRKVDSWAKPLNLTEEVGTRDEDPGFAPNGKRIVFKQNGEIRIMDLTNQQIQSIPSGDAKVLAAQYLQGWT